MGGEGKVKKPEKICKFFDKIINALFSSFINN